MTCRMTDRRDRRATRSKIPAHRVPQSAGNHWVPEDLPCGTLRRICFGILQHQRISFLKSVLCGDLPCGVAITDLTESFWSSSASLSTHAWVFGNFGMNGGSSMWKATETRSGNVCIYAWSLVGAGGSSMWNNGQRSRMDKMRDAIRNITTFHQRSKYAEDDDEEQSGGLKKKRKKKPFSLPHWTTYIAWIR